jgi:hypothetical protein
MWSGKAQFVSYKVRERETYGMSIQTFPFFAYLFLFVGSFSLGLFFPWRLRFCSSLCCLSCNLFKKSFVLSIITLLHHPSFLLYPDKMKTYWMRMTNEGLENIKLFDTFELHYEVEGAIKWEIRKFYLLHLRIFLL